MKKWGKLGIRCIRNIWITWIHFFSLDTTSRDGLDHMRKMHEDIEITDDIKSHEPLTEIQVNAGKFKSLTLDDAHWEEESVHP